MTAFDSHRQLVDVDRLQGSNVRICGAGRLAKPAAEELVKAGVGHLSLIDYDRVERSNLGYEAADEKRFKVEALADRLKRINPAVAVNTITERISEQTVRDVLARSRPADCTLIAIDDPQAVDLLVAQSHRSSPTVVVNQAAGEGFGELIWAQYPKTPCVRCSRPGPPRRAVAGGQTLPVHVQMVATAAATFVLGLLLYQKRGWRFFEHLFDDCRPYGILQLAPNPFVPFEAPTVPFFLKLIQVVSPGWAPACPVCDAYLAGVRNKRR